MFDTGLPSLQVALDWSHPFGTVSETPYPDPTGTLLKTWVLDKVAFASSSSWNELGLSPKTISTYRGRILEKLKLNSSAAIIRYAIENRLVS